MKDFAMALSQRLRPRRWMCVLGLALLIGSSSASGQEWPGMAHPAAYLAPAGESWPVAPVDFQVVEAQAADYQPPEPLGPHATAELVAESLPEALPKASNYNPYNYGPYAYYVPPVPYSEYCRLTRIYRSWFLGRLWTRAEILGWDTTGSEYPALVTSAPLGSPLASAGELDEAGTVIEFGGTEFHDEMRAGGRLTLGLWFDPSQWGGIQGSYFGVEGKEVKAHYVGDGDEIFARPFFDVPGAQEEAQVSLYPGVLTGTIDVEADSDLQGAEALLRRALLTSPSARLDFVGGYRYGRLYDNLRVHDSLLSLDASSGFAPGTVIERRDLFNTTNKFHGGVAGLIYQRKVGLVSIETTGKFGFGSTRSIITVDGFTSENGVATSGGVLTAPSNIVSFDESSAAYMNEFNVTLGYEFTCQLHAAVGYNLIYWTEVARVGDQIDRGVGAGRPLNDFERTDFWTQGLNLGIHYQF